MKPLYQFSLIVFGILICVHSIIGESVTNVELSTGWTLTNQNGSHHIKDLKVPSGVYSALYGEALLQSYNDVDMRWIAYDNWTYTKTFEVDLTNQRNLVNLTFYGIDTVAEIILNNDFLGKVDNMFVQYTFEVTERLQWTNVLEIKIQSPVYAALERAQALAAENKEVPPYCPPNRYHGECHMNMLRKMQASFGWDWGLAAPSMGIWKPIYLEFYEVAILRDIDVVTNKNRTHWNMNIIVYMDTFGENEFYAELTFYAVELMNRVVVIKDHRDVPIKAKSPVIRYEQAIPINQVVAWWPNGYGDQKLYPLHFKLNAWRGKDRPSAKKTTVSSKTIRIGFRTIELVESQAPAKDGNTFLFKVNGVEIFMKGSNYIPSHILPEMTHDMTRIKHLLVSAKQAHMNMIRVWGGGIYESDAFYNLADSLGLLIFQDMMFACAMYPVTEDFLRSVRTEIAQNSRRLSHHPSIAIFATNNENEAALVMNWYNTSRNRVRFDAEYRQLYLANVIHELKAVEHDGRPKSLVSSPSNGKESEKDEFISPNPSDPQFGDVHFYDILRDAWNVNIYPRPRFASEYGFQSLPSLQSWQRVLNNTDDLMELIHHREHHPAGLDVFLILVRIHLPLPLPEDANYPEALIYFSQISQAMATKTETELYRSLRNTDHRTMGALYWQLNDIWVAPSWSSIDFFGNYKLLQYWARNFMAPITIVALYDSHSATVNVSLICDYLKVNRKDLTVTMNVYLWSNLYPKNSTVWPATLKPNGVHYDKVISVDDIFSKHLTKQNSFVEFVLLQQNSVLSRTFYFPIPIKAAVGVKDPEININFASRYCGKDNELKMNSYSLTISVTRPAIFVYIELLKPYQYKLSKNGYMQVTPVDMIHLEFESSSCVRLKVSDIKVSTVNQYMHQ